MRLNQKGLTLFEILIAISVLSFMMLGVIQFTQTAFDTSERVTREDAESFQIETAMSRLEWDISQAYTPLYFDHLMKPEEMSDKEKEAYQQIIPAYENNNRFKGPSYTGLPIPLVELKDKTTLIFFSSSNRRKIQNSKQSHYAWIRYSLEANDEEFDSDLPQNTTKERQSTEMLVRQINNQDVYNPDRLEWDDVKTQVLHRKITKMKFEFWNPAKFKWTDNLSLIKNGKYILYGVRVTIEYLNADNLPQETVRIFRPLYPEFTPEDTYKFLNEKPKSTTTPTTKPGGISN